MVGRRRQKSSLDDHAIAITGKAVARGTIDVVAFLTAPKIGGCDFERENVGQVAVDSSCVEQFVREGVYGGNSSFDRLASRTTIAEKGAGNLGVVLGLEMHIKATGSEGQHEQENRQREREVTTDLAFTAWH
jgi:hypothetical protein